MRRLLVRPLAFAASFALGGCAIFSSKPPLPKHASIERAGRPAATTDYRALLDQADIIYFPEDRAGAAGRSEPAALLLEAAKESGHVYALAWGLIDVRQQPLLDELQANTGPARDELIDKLELAGSGRAREHCRSVLRDARFAGVRHLALRAPAALLEKAAAGSLAPDEREYLPRGFTLPAGGFQAYAERVSGSAGYDERALAAAYRAEVLRRQLAAETIVRQVRAAGTDARLIVFASATDFADAHGIPFYVAQKIGMRQLVLDRETGEPARSPLLTRLELGLRSGLEVVDRTPGAAGD